MDDTAKIHTVKATVVGGAGLGSESIGLDYIVVSPGKKTPLVGRTLMVDDMYSGLSFGSGWIITETVFNLLSYADFPAFSFHNTTHTTSTPGSMFSFSYTGKQSILFAIFSDSLCASRLKPVTLWCL